MKKLTVTTLTLLLTAGMLFAEGWELAKDKNGIRVFTQDIAGKSVDKFKGVAVVDAPLAVIIEVLKDVNNYHLWYGSCKLQRRLKQYSPLESLVYHVQKVPVITNRDVVVHGKITVDYTKGTASQVMRAVKSEYKKDSGNVRMPSMDGKFLMKSISPSSTRVTYIMQVDPGGSVPGWLANSTAKKQPYTTLEGLRRVVKNPKYAELAKIIKK